VTALGSDPASTAPAAAVEALVDWVAALSEPGPGQDAAMRELHALMLRAARSQVHRMRSMLGGVGPEVVEEIANQSADEAMMALLRKLTTFEGRSRFTTWAYKFAILQAATDVRSRAWRDRDVRLDSLEQLPATAGGPEQYAVASDLAAVVRQAIETDLTPHQRRILVALVIDEVPIDVLAERLGANRNALYKTLHDARVRLRASLRRSGHLVDVDREAGRP
jgi:RNA polymerase sigma-70 factor, ECF subfamily